MNLCTPTSLTREAILDLDARYCTRYGLFDAMAIDAAARARRRGHMHFDEFIAIATWKLASSGSLAFERATEQQVHERSAAAFSCWSQDLQALSHIDAITGIGFRAATAIMHLTFGEHYPMLDQRVLRSLGVETSQVATLMQDDGRLRALWPAFAHHCRVEAQRIDVFLRQFDRALWWLDRAKSTSLHVSSSV